MAETSAIGIFLLIDMFQIGNLQMLPKYHRSKRPSFLLKGFCGRPSVTPAEKYQQCIQLIQLQLGIQFSRGAPNALTQNKHEQSGYGDLALDLLLIGSTWYCLANKICYAPATDSTSTADVESTWLRQQSMVVWILILSKQKVSASLYITSSTRSKTFAICTSNEHHPHSLGQ